MACIRSSAGSLASLALVVAQVAPVPAVLAPIAAAPAAAQTRYVDVTCQSNGNQARTCRLPNGTQSVTFKGPDRSGRCREGQTWRQSGNQLTVWGGCGGTFEAAVYGGSGGSGGGSWGGSGGGSWGGSGGSNWGGGNQGFAGEITCRSENNRERQCRVNTGGRVQMLQQYSNSPCVQGQSWRYDRDSITVRNGCQARFGYGYGNGNDGNWGGSGGGNWGGSNQGFAGQTECRSQNNRYQRCQVYTDNRVELLRQISSSACTRGRSWGYDRNSIWVNYGCQARFGYGYGNVSGSYDGNYGGSSSNSGSNAGGIIAGGLLAAGLIAALAAANKGDRSGQSTRGPATVEADWAKFPSAARSEAQACMNEAARQIGATGGSRVQLRDVTTAQQSGNGWMLLADVTGTWDDHVQTMRMDCRASSGKVTAFDVK